MDAHEDPWALLGVKRDAASVEIKFAFRKLALEYHPDKQTTEADKAAANQIFAKLSHAYEIASDPDQAAQWLQDEKKRQEAATKQPSPPHASAAPRGTPQSAAGRPRGTPAAQRGPPPPQQQGRGAPQGRSSAAAPGTRSTTGRPGAPPPQQQQQLATRSAPRQGGPPPEQPRPRAGEKGAMVKTSSGQGRGPASGSSSSSAKGNNNPMMYYPKPGEGPAPRTVNTTPRPPSSSTSGTVKYYRDPFEVFDNIMTEEFGKDYKKKDAWVKSTGAPNLASINPFVRKSENSRKEFRKLDVDGDKSLSRTELSKYISSHSDLWTNLGCSLDLPVYKCIDIATDVAICLAMQKGDNYTHTSIPTRDLTEAEFKYFHQHYVLNEKGAQEFYLRTIFAAFDVNKDGVLSARELDRFLDIFYRARDTFKGSMKLPDRKTLNQTIRQRCDKNKDGVLNFKEVKDLLVVAAVVTADNRDS